MRIAGRNLEKFLAGDVDGMKNLVDFETGYRKSERRWLVWILIENRDR